MKQMFFPFALIAGLGLMLAGRVTAQTFTTLHSFSVGGYNASNAYTNSDGTEPSARLVASGNILYGTAYAGGRFGNGTVFAMKMNSCSTSNAASNGAGFTNLYNFSATSGALSTNSDGAGPAAKLILSGDTLYGTAYRGGRSGKGTLFAVKTNGTGFTNLHNFSTTSGSLSTNSDGASPNGELILSVFTLFGTATGGGTSGSGTVFKMNTDGTGFTTLYNFTATSGPLSTNRDGAAPAGGLVLSGSTLFGTTSAGGSSGSGTIFALNVNGTGFSNLYSFKALSHPYGGTNSDGASPMAALILSANTLYGTAFQGGSSGNGTVFKFKTNGTSFTNLHNFTATSGPYPSTNQDGAFSFAGLILSGETLYGTAYAGGSFGNGTVFQLNTNGNGFTTLHSFTGLGALTGANDDGANPACGLILSGRNLFGTASGGGLRKGTVFRLFIPPQLVIVADGSNVILTWSTNASDFVLQSSSASAGIFTNIKGATSPYTNPITGSQKFYRLSQ